MTNLISPSKGLFKPLIIHLDHMHIQESENLEFKPIHDHFLQDGYFIGQFSDLEIVYLTRKLILEQILQTSNIRFKSWEDLVRNYVRCNIHNQFSTKQTRLFSNAFHDAELLNQSLIYFFTKLIGSFKISDEESYGYPEIYWRIVRPFEDSDIGSLHADYWFWDINSWKLPSEFNTRIKIWIPLETEFSKNGLLVVRGSHLIDYLYKFKSDGAKMRPCICSEHIGKVELLNIPVGSYIIFHDRLIHGGAKNLGLNPRISFEFTCLQ